MRRPVVVSLVTSVVVALGVTLAPVSATAAPSTAPAAAPSAPAASAVGPRMRILLVATYGRSTWGTPIKRMLKDQGFHVDIVTSLPTDLSTWGQVWVSGCERRLAAEEETRLVEFEQAGGSLLLTGERAPCVGTNRTVKAVADQVVTTWGADGLVFGPSDIDANNDQVINTGAIHAVASTPAPATAFRDAWGGSIDMKALPRRNALAWTARYGYASVAVFDRSDVVGGVDGVGGRLAIVMDVNWADPRYAGPTAPQVAVNLATFLRGVAS